MSVEPHQARARAPRAELGAGTATAGMLVVLLGLFAAREAGIRYVASETLRVEVAALRQRNDPWGRPWCYAQAAEGKDQWTRYSSGENGRDEKLAGDDVAVRTPTSWLGIVLTEDPLLLLAALLVPCGIWARLTHLGRPRGTPGAEVLTALAMGIPGAGIAAAGAVYVAQRIPDLVSWNPLGIPSEVSVGLPAAALFVGATLVLRQRFPPAAAPGKREPGG